jgi:hypothetical protein
LHIVVNGISQSIPISSVPYAFHAKTVEDDSDTLDSLPCISGQVAEWNGGSWVCADNASGPPGEKGDTGTKGEQGIQGPKGEKGDTGALGLQGFKGEKGDRGDTGPMGPQGFKGEKGDTGSQGPEGEQGVQGIVGLTGPQGLKGDKGDTGSPGLDGSQDPQIAIESGYVLKDANSPSWDLNLGSGLRSYEIQVSFQQKFSQKPQVIIGLHYIDAGAHVRIGTTVKDITTSGFVLAFNTWADTMVWGAGASWFAYGYR